MIRLDLSSSSANAEKYAQPLQQAHTWLQEATGQGSDFVGWVNLPRDYDKAEYQRIQAAARKIQSDSKALVVIGIGGSYLGARAVIELVSSNNYNLKKKDTPNIYFTGNGLSGDSMQEVMDLIGDDDFSVNVISKSGTTTEPAVAFRFFKAMLEKKYGKAEAAKRIYATTDKARGALKSLAGAEGYDTYVVPDDVGGRYSVLTAVGLLPIAAAGIDIEALMAGAAEEMELLSKPGMWMQNLTTSEPDDSMIEVAIAAVEAVFDWKTYLRENFPETKVLEERSEQVAEIVETEGNKTKDQKSGAIKPGSEKL